MTKKAKTYGSSLYDLAQEEGLQKTILEDLRNVKAIFDEIPEYRKMLSTPALSKDERKAAISEAWGGKIHQYSLNFLYILCDNEMIGELSDCEQEFHSRFNKENGIATVVAYSSAPLSEETKAKLCAAVEKKTGKKVELSTKVDESLIGGLRLEMDGKAYDSTVRYHMDALKQLLNE